MRAGDSKGAVHASSLEDPNVSTLHGSTGLGGMKGVASLELLVQGSARNSDRTLLKDVESP